ncbi:MAG: hypothetical protein HOH19_11620 [Kordiimonadaceae bacterium]|jgi:hypothetical protein|nr:hypothetical protein [Kordiimonadaceae bacterium]MBT6033218.1 hypothetical protein [Kordiimonadaceae bacterium]
MTEIKLGITIQDVGDVSEFNKEMSLDLFALSTYTFEGNFNLIINNIDFSVSDTHVLNIILQFIMALTSSANSSEKESVGQIYIPIYPEVIELRREKSKVLICTTEHPISQLEAECDFFDLYQAMYIQLNEILSLLYKSNSDISEISLREIFSLEQMRRKWIRQNSPKFQNDTNEVLIRTID